ncbi:MAG: hypothetical protein ACRD3I_12230 [Terriglobales bacterium]
MMGIADAESVEHGTPSGNYVIVPVSCALPNRAPGAPKLSGEDELRIMPGTILHRILGSDRTREGFFCNYEVSPLFETRLEAAGLRISARGPQNEIRAVELPGHRFYLATLFQPQLTSEATGEPHPVIAAYLEAARAFQAARQTAADD